MLLKHFGFGWRIGLLLVLMLGGLAADTKADTITGSITFHDLTDTVTVTTSGSVPGSVGPGTECGSEFPESACFTFISPPGTIAIDVALGVSSHPEDQALFISEPNGNTLSDEFLTFPSDKGLGLLFLSNLVLLFNEPCTSVRPTGCDLAEDGTVQSAGFVGFVGQGGSNLETITVSFQSDVESSVPEPSALLLLGSGLLGLAGAGRRKWLG